MSETIVIKVGDNHTLSALANMLVDFGYEKVSGVELLSGQFSFIGDTLRIFLIDSVSLFVVDFFGNQIEKIRTADGVRTIEQLTVKRNILRLTDNSLIRHGDYVVHEDHGIGIFDRIGLKKAGNELISYAYIRYLNDDVLYLPLGQEEKLSRYIGVGKKHPKLSKLGSQTWSKTYQKVYENVIQLARELLMLYANRQINLKSPRKINQEWESIVRSTFDFSETPDQLKSINEVFSDLSSKVPMDRLICGDVGFGKTEIALRAAVQTVANGYQVAFLVPTTILAEQHYTTLRNRLKDLPINIEHLSRFVSTSESVKIIENIEKGSVDILVGTHAILNSIVNFKKLGLLIIDEEQKFGVRHKEKIKKNESAIDVLTLTATPIPRTLFMSLSGIRDISVVNSVPFGRKAVETEIARKDDELIKRYIERELTRFGQVYYLHNEVRTIGNVKNRLSKIFPEAKIEAAHGQLTEMELADRMNRFATREIDILVCSTIIENGLDLPNVNTLIVDESDKFGLPQLYQIRGRIGRSKKQGYALFTYNNKQLTQNAMKRLKAIAENSELGGGYQIALEDLEIRGGGNILGKEQHGSMETVGLVLYSKMLKIAVEKIRKGESFESL